MPTIKLRAALLKQEINARLEKLNKEYETHLDVTAQNLMVLNPDTRPFYKRWLRIGKPTPMSFDRARQLARWQEEFETWTNNAINDEAAKLIRMCAASQDGNITVDEKAIRWL